MTTRFPHVDLTALKDFATKAAEQEYRTRVSEQLLPGFGEIIQAVRQPRITSCEDTEWAGVNMILITFDRSSMPLGPHEMLAHFPVGRPRMVTQALVGMTSALLETGHIDAPRIYSYMDYTPNKVGAEVVLLEKVPGDSLQDAWPNLTSRQTTAVVARLSELLLDLFNLRAPLICSRLSTPQNPPPADASSSAPRTQTGTPNPPPPSSAQRGFLLARPFDERPFSALEPQRALLTSRDYLSALAQRFPRLLSNPAALAAIPECRNGPPLEPARVSGILETWSRLESLVPYHCGGFYIPGTLSQEARTLADSVLKSKRFGVFHSDMRMSRFIVNISHDNPDDVSLTLTGWEHAYHAPLWACSRLPSWMSPSLIPDHHLVPPDRRGELRNMIYSNISQANSPNPPTGRRVENCWEWTAAYVFGDTERWFEGCVAAHWIFRDNVELLLKRLKAFWRSACPDIPFPIPVAGDEDDRDRRTAAAGQSSGSERQRDLDSSAGRRGGGGGGGAHAHSGSLSLGEEEFASAHALFLDSVQALARASGTSAEDWDVVR